MGDLLPVQLDLLEAQLERQEAAMTGRVSNSNTRAAILIGASGVLGGTELVTASGNPWISGGTLILYLLAALSGLRVMRSRLGEQPDLPGTIVEYATIRAVWLRRSLLASRISSHEKSRTQLNHRQVWLTLGFLLLVLAWTASGVGTIYGITHPQPVNPTVIQIEGISNAP